MTEPLGMTQEERELVDWCCLALTEEQVADCHDEAAEIAGPEIHAEEAAELLVRTLVKVMIRNGRKEMAMAKTTKDEREQLEAEITEHIRTQVQDTILTHVPDNWSDQQRQELEMRMMLDAKRTLSALTTAELRSPSALDNYIRSAADEAMRMLRGWR